MWMNLILLTIYAFNGRIKNNTQDELSGTLITQIKVHLLF